MIPPKDSPLSAWADIVEEVYVAATREPWPYLTTRREEIAGILREKYGVDMDEKDRQILLAMERFGGGFVSALAKAGLRADLDNIRRMKAAWPEYWSQYEKLAEIEHAAATARPIV